MFISFQQFSSWLLNEIGAHARQVFTSRNFTLPIAILYDAGGKFWWQLADDAWSSTVPHSKKTLAVKKFWWITAIRRPFLPFSLFPYILYANGLQFTKVKCFHRQRFLLYGILTLLYTTTAYYYTVYCLLFLVKNLLFHVFIFIPDNRSQLPALQGFIVFTYKKLPKNFHSYKVICKKYGSFSQQIISNIYHMHM